MFLEERITEKILYGSSFSEEYEVVVSQVSGGNDYTKLRHPYPRLRYDINLADFDDTVVQSLVDLYHRSGGMFGGFRVKHHTDYSTNNYKGVPTFNDQKALLESAGIYQIIRWYGDESDNASTRRRIKKPVSGSVLVGIRDDFSNPVQLVNGYTVDDTTGLITFSANNQKSITAISQDTQAIINVGASHGYLVDDSVHFSSVVGMTELNGLRGKVVAIGASAITVDINTTGFSAYVSGGQVNTQPQANEIVTAGCYFDIPCRFDADLNGINFKTYKILTASMPVVEKLNP
jgi:uncharacterized protein (TIGR02217 family)